MSYGEITTGSCGTVRLSVAARSASARQASVRCST
jgi:hypothetical protein